jgi:hypothetical protein
MKSLDESVLGNIMSHWRHAEESLNQVMGKVDFPIDDREQWAWIRNPLPPSTESLDFEIIRRSLNIGNDVSCVPGSDWENLRETDKARIRNLSHNFIKNHNPFIRHIVRRTRDFLETEINPVTKEPYLKPIKVMLFGEENQDALSLTLYLKEAYTLAEEFCHVFSKRARGCGFLKTLLLRRVGSTLYAGKRTSETLLGIKPENLEVEEEEEDIAQESGIFKDMPDDEKKLLKRFLDIISEHQDEYPKYQKIREQAALKK